MGVYATNTYNLTIPMTEVGKITSEFRDKVRGTWYELPAEWEADTPEALVDIITQTFGCDDKAEGPRIEGDSLILCDSTFGKVGDTEALCATLAEHGVTGTIESEVDGEFWLTSIRDGGWNDHKGVVTYPTYEASS
jgi:hypothetical protein